jgi:hypothetical protein
MNRDKVIVAVINDEESILRRWSAGLLRTLSEAAPISPLSRRRESGLSCAGPFHDVDELLSGFGLIGSVEYQAAGNRTYYKAESRGFEPGRELDDWLEAEQELTGSARFHKVGAKVS